MKEVDNNGFWRIKDNPLSKEGVFPYLGKQIDKSLEPNKIYWVYRPMSELSKPETVESFNAVPMIDEHEMIGEGFTPYDDRPAGGVIYNTKAKDGKLYGDIKIFSEQLKDEIQSGKKELSMGYECNYEPQKGVFEGKEYDFVQTNLRGNHVALVNRGRMGSDVRVYDHYTFDTLEGIGEMEQITEDKDNDIQWITVNGNHIPIKAGQSKEEAVKSFINSKNEYSEKAIQERVDKLEKKVEKALEDNNKDAYEAYSAQLEIEKTNLSDLKKAEITLGKMSEEEGGFDFRTKAIIERKDALKQAEQRLEKAQTDYKNNPTPFFEESLKAEKRSVERARENLERAVKQDRKEKGLDNKEIPSQDGSPKESGVGSSFNIKGEDTLEKVDKRKGISEVEAMLYEAKKDPAKLTDELIKTILQKMENNSYNASEKTKADDEACGKSEDEEKSCSDGCKAKDECGKKDDMKDDSGVAKKEADEEAPTEEKKDEGKKEDKKAEDAAIAVMDALPEILDSLKRIEAAMAQKSDETKSEVMYGLDETPDNNKEDMVLKRYLGEI